MLGTLEPSNKSDWKSYIPSLVYAYNCTRHESTKASPFELMFGRKPQLLIDSLFETLEIEETTNKTTKEYIEDLKTRMKTTQVIAKKYTDKARQKQKQQYDKKDRASRITIGDKVLVKILAFEGKHKIADKFEEEVYEVIEQPRDEIPVFKLRSPSGEVRTLHRNHHLPIEKTEARNETGNDIAPNIRRPIPKPRKLKETQDISSEVKGEATVTPKYTKQVEINDVTSDEESSDSDNDYVTNTYMSGDVHISEQKVEGKKVQEDKVTSGGDTPHTDMIEETDIVVIDEGNGIQVVVNEMKQKAVIQTTMRKKLKKLEQM